MGKLALLRDMQECMNQDQNLAHRTLVIGNIARWTSEGREPAPCMNVGFSELNDFTGTAFLQLDPAIILSPLIGDDFDVVDVAVRLNELGFSGQYRAITEPLPNRNLIRKEVKGHAPFLDFDLLMMTPIANEC